MKMLGGGRPNENTMIPCFTEENRVPNDINTLPHLQLFGHAPAQVHAGTGSTNCRSNEHAPTRNGFNKRLREENPVFMQHKLHISSAKNYGPNEVGQMGNLQNLNPVSTGLKLSCEEEEHSSSATYASEHMKNVVPGIFYLDSTLRMEMGLQAQEFDRYAKLQEETVLKGIKELNQKHMVCLMNALEQGVNRKIHEKELEIENINRKNKELGDKIRQVSMEAQSWHYRAQYNESVVSVLQSNIQQLMAQGTAVAHEGTGESEVDDAVSGTDHSETFKLNGRLICRSCKNKEVSFLLLPCRHLCLCPNCEGFIDVCPVCRLMKTASVHVHI
ncbi:BOI-related E3 ubiquitin-protein ligase 1-like isoform X2 [Henckelia pumila]|uniref:BOI-related E3 ubiquitin-protein ligase 1-like isoform X2 n=1 Tax=Henckelia pumila TaxID=405737 RepID=UPI003C6E2BEB